MCELNSRAGWPPMTDEPVPADLLAVEHAARVRAERLQRLTAALSAAATLDQVCDAVLIASTAATGADAGVIALAAAADGPLEVVAERGDPRRIAGETRTFARDARLPLADAFRRGEPVFVAAERRHAGSAAALGAGGAAALPLVVRGEVRGALGLRFPGRRDFPVDDRIFLGMLADQCAQALERARLYEAEEAALRHAEEARDRLALLARASKALAESLDYDKTLRQVAYLAVPQLADWCSIELLADDGRPRNVVVAHSDPDRVAMAEDFRRRFPPAPGATSGVANVLRTGEPEVYPHITDELLAQQLEDPEALTLARGLGFVSAMILPLSARGRIFGAVTLVSAESGRHYGDDDVEFAGELAARAALAIDNARLYDEERRIAETLQQSLLPESLADTPEAAVAARYVPAGPAVQVGGDWYDAISLDDDRVGIVIGDVVGHGIAAAAVMGQLRNALRAYAVEGHGPAAALERMAALVERGDRGGSMLGTVLFLVYDTLTSTARFASAGHLPPLLIPPAGRPRFLDGGRSLPLGVAPGPSFEEVCVSIEPGSTILLYTDGLVERRDEALTAGLERLARVVADGPADLEALCDHLIEHSREPGAATDDVALVAVRPAPLPAEGFSLELPAEPAAVSRARHTLQRWLARAGASEDETYDLAVALSDACANAVEHAYGPRHGLFKVEVSRVDEDVVIAVRDFGSWRPPRGAHRGRGLALIRTLTDSLDVDRAPTGTCVTMRRRLKAGAAAGPDGGGAASPPTLRP